MIEIIDNNKYRYFKSFDGPYIIFFYNKSEECVKDPLNLSMIKYIQSLESYYCDLPILAFEFNTFILSNNIPNLTSCNDIMIIRKTKFNEIYEQPPPWKILKIFDDIRNERLLKNINTLLRRKESPLKPWVLNSHKIKLENIYASDEERIRYLDSLMQIKYEDVLLLEKFHTNANRMMKIKIPLATKFYFDSKRESYKRKIANRFKKYKILYQNMSSSNKCYSSDKNDVICSENNIKYILKNKIMSKINK